MDLPQDGVKLEQPRLLLGPLLHNNKGMYTKTA